MIQPQGIIPALITPFDEQQNLNKHGLKVIINYLIDLGVNGIFCLGTNGEFFSLTHDEKLEVTRIVVEEVKGRVPVYVGAGCNGTKETVDFIRMLEAIGVDALSIITPYFLTLTQKELINHYKTIAASTKLPIMLYNIPSRTKNYFEPGSVAELAKESNIVGIKDSSGDYDNILNYLKVTSDNFSVMVGSDQLILQSLIAGCKGAIASTANLAPALVLSIYNNWKQGNIELAQKAQELLLPICDTFGFGTLPSVLKASMNLLGLPAGEPRLPVNNLNSDQIAQLVELNDIYVKNNSMKRLF